MKCLIIDIVSGIIVIIICILLGWFWFSYFQPWLVQWCLMLKHILLSTLISTGKLSVQCKLSSSPFEIAVCNLMASMQNLYLKTIVELSEYISDLSRSQNIFALFSLFLSIYSMLAQVPQVMACLIRRVLWNIVSVYRQVHQQISWIVLRLF